MATAQSKRCSTCNIYYPLQAPFTKCPVCDTTLWSSSDPPDDLWEWEAESKRQANEKAAHIERVQNAFGTTPIDIPRFDVTLYEVVTDLAWTVRVMDIYEHQNKRKLLSPGELIEVGDTLYEVTGPSFRPPDGTGPKYLLRRYEADTFVPREWVKEFEDGD